MRRDGSAIMLEKPRSEAKVMVQTATIASASYWNIFLQT